MPSRAWPIWLYSFLLIVGYPIANGVYAMLASRSGIAPAEGSLVDTHDALSGLFMACPFVVGAVWFCTRRYNPETRLLSWHRERLFRSIVATFLFVSIVLLAPLALMGEVSDDWRPYDVVWVIYLALCLPWPLALRAALVDQRGEILHQPRLLSALAWLMTTIFYLSAGVMASAIATGAMYLFGYRQDAGNFHDLPAYLLFLAMFGACTYFAFRNVEEPKLKVALLLIPVLIVWLVGFAIT
jgi:hypothetical protein